MRGLLSTTFFAFIGLDFARGTLREKLTVHNCSVSADFANECVFWLKLRFGLCLLHPLPLFLIWNIFDIFCRYSDMLSAVVL